MKKLTLIFAAALLALVAGIVIVWASGILQRLSLVSNKTSSSAPTKTAPDTPSPTNEELGKIVLHFKGFELSKDWTANFEVVNFTTKPIIYIGFKRKDKFDFCTLAAQKDAVSETTGVKIHHFGNDTKYNCLYSGAVILQTIEPNESILFSVFKYEVQELVNIRELKSAQIGFEILIGDEKRREMLWSEEITFPEDTP